ncbi:MAG TPA: PAS domain S-box protein [Steroidobacteraceae bacterium]|nr:PAS domain S-box protein [Steroidobacteraceae bacterium]
MRWGSEEKRLRSAALKNAESVLVARRDAERKLLATKEALERKTRELQASEERFRAAFTQAAVGIGVCGLDHRFVNVNPKFCEIVGYSVEELRRLTFGAITHPDDLAATEAEVKRLLAGEIPHYVLAKRYVRKDGSTVWSRTTVTLLRNSAGDAEQLIGVIEDIGDRVLAEEAGQASAAHLSALIASSEDAIISKTLDGIITTWNHAAQRMFGYSAEEAIGKSIMLLIPEDHAAEEPLIIERLKRCERIEHYETVRVKKDGTRFEVSLSVSPIITPDGAVIGASKIARDITRQREIEEALREESRILELLNTTGQAIAAQLDLHALVQTVTDAATDISGAEFGAFFYNVIDGAGEAYLLYALCGAPRDAFERLGLPRNTPVFEPTFRGEGVVRSADITRDPRYGTMAPHHGMPHGHLPVRSYLAVPVISRTGEVIGGLFFGHSEPDIFTERSERLVLAVAAQAAVAIDNARLYESAQREITQRERAEAALLETDRRKDEFLATLAHELRNPLAPIRQAALIARAPNATEAQKRWSHDVIERQVHQMALLLEDLLDISRITRGTLDLRTEMTDLATVVSTAVETARPAIDAKGHLLSLELPSQEVRFAADPLRVAQVLSNLLTNAAKYTDRGGQIRLRAACEAGHVAISVLDTGIGIPAEALEDVFAMFSQVKSGQDRSEGGLGIGLALSKGLVRLHGGTIEARSAGVGHGSEFIVRFPLQMAEVAHAEDVEPVARSHSVRRRVLIADDNRAAAESLAMLLQMEGHDVQVAYDGEEALNLFATMQPDVALLDIGMPKVNGYEVARQARKHANGRKVTFIAVTGWGQDKDRANAVEAGFNFHFTKPVDVDRLMELLRSADI